MLFVDDDESKILNRSKDAGTRTHHDASLARLDAPPLFRALDLVKCRVKNRHLIAEAPQKLSRDGRGQSDLRNQQQCAAAIRETGVDRSQIYLCFSRSRDALQ